ncbi:MAG: hypothetical protein MMC33_006952 [Icmadophila ericetorum]|nr:hypothetical protein [Icmadophila ericetorum]
MPNDKAEAYIARQSPPIQSSKDQLAPVLDSAMSVEFLNSPTFNMQLPSLASSTDRFFPSNRNGYQQQSITQFSSNLDSDFLNSPTMTMCNDPTSFRVENLTPPEDASESPLFHVQMPSLREIRALNSTASSSSSSIFSLSKSEKGEHAENSSRILAELQAFSLAIFVTQAEIAGISSAVAEYLAWVRKIPGMPKMPNCAAVLETLENRVRELHEMAENKHWAAWRQMLEKLDGMGTQLSVFGAEMQNRTVETAQFFHASYDVGKAMQEQRPLADLPQHD